MSYRHTKEMGEISGFGGSYEDACQDMLERGVNWLVSNPDRRDLKASGFDGVFGLLTAESADMKELEAHVMNGADGASGAMHHAVMSRLMWIAANGWNAYVSELMKIQHEAAP